MAWEDAPLTPAPDVAIVAWPRERERRASLAARSVPCLLVIEPGDDVPDLADGEDWVHRSTDERDVAIRLDALRRGGRREQAASGHDMVGLSRDEHRVASRLLMSQGALVPRADLPVPDLDAVIEAVRTNLEDEWLVHAVGESGFLIEKRPT